MFSKLTKYQNSISTHRPHLHLEAGIFSEHRLKFILFWKQQFIRPVGWAEPGLVLLREPAKAAARELKGDPRGHRRLVSASPPTCVCSLCAYINKTVMCVDFHVLLLLLLQKAWLAQPGLLRREPGELGWIIVGFWGRFKYAFLGAFQEFVPKTTLFD